LIVGIALRAFHYIHNRSLWEDEVFLASSLVHMDFKALTFQPLEYMQRAPLGFLWLEKLAVSMFGNHEMSLRLVPLLASITSLFLSIRIGRFFLKSQIAFLATFALLAVAPPLVYHAVEAKQYAMEQLATTLGLYLYTRYYQTRAVGSLIWWGIAGACIVWVSFSSLFVFFGIAGAVGLQDLYRRNWKLLWLHLIPFSLWILSFLIQYVYFISRFPEEEWLIQFWRNRDAFMPLIPHNLSDLAWPIKQIYGLIRYPMGLSWFELDYTIPYPQWLRVLARFPLIPMIIGLMGLWRLLRREKGTLLQWSMPVLLTLVASGLELYPVKERMAIFLSPLFLLVIGKGIEHLQRQRLSTKTFNLIVMLLLAAPTLNSGAHVINPDLFGEYKQSKQREAMQFLAQNYREGDVVYVYWNNLPSYKFYEEVYGLKFNVIYGSDARGQSTDFTSYFQNLAPELAPLEKHRRVWFMYKAHNGLKLGDIENEPKWYYNQVSAYHRVVSHMNRFGTPSNRYPKQGQFSDVELVLFEKE
jgi:4-amino-4-deoxy-L-arabinose transferase-like glycosyltransferase